MDGLTITITDITAAGHCASGAKHWFADHDLDFRSFLKEGIDADTLLATGDAMAQQVVRRKVERELRDLQLPDGFTLTIDDVRASMKCAAGIREWAARQGLDYGAFVKDGIPAAALIATADWRAVRMVREAVLRRG